MNTSKKNVSLDDPYYDRLKLFLQASNCETERGQALVVASLIEEMLEEILRVFLLPNKATKSLFSSLNAPMSNFSAKSLLCRSLGLISQEEFQDIDNVRKIRNEFAHNLICSFSERKISDLTKSLKTGMSCLDKLEEGHKAKISDPKSRFIMASTSIITSLYNRAHYVSKIKIQDQIFIN